MRLSSSFISSAHVHDDGWVDRRALWVRMCPSARRDQAPGLGPRRRAENNVEAPLKSPVRAACQRPNLRNVSSLRSQERSRPAPGEIRDQTQAHQKGQHAAGSTPPAAAEPDTNPSPPLPSRLSCRRGPRWLNSRRGRSCASTSTWRRPRPKTTTAGPINPGPSSPPLTR